MDDETAGDSTEEESDETTEEESDDTTTTDIPCNIPDLGTIIILETLCFTTTRPGSCLYRVVFRRVVYIRVVRVTPASIAL